MPNEQIISERVVSKRVIGSSNPVMRFGRNLKSSFSGIIFGIILVIASMVGLVWGEHLDKNSKILETMPVLTAQEAVQKNGESVIVKGTPTITKEIEGVALDEPTLYYHHTIENLETKLVTEEETEIIEEDGQDVEVTKEVTKLVDEWVVEKDEAKWAGFKIGDINISPENASLSHATLKTIKEEGSEETKRREIVRILPLEDLTVIGLMQSSSIKSGDPFIIANATKDQILEQMISSERTMYWIIKIACLIGLIIGFQLILGPLLTLVGVIPILGSITKFGALAVSIVVALVITVLLSLISKFWYIVIILVVALVAYIIYGSMQKKKGSTSKSSEPDLPTEA